MTNAAIRLSREHEHELFQQLLQHSIECSSAEAFLQNSLSSLCKLAQADGCRLVSWDAEGKATVAAEFPAPSDNPPTGLPCSAATRRKLARPKVVKTKFAAQASLCLDTAWAGQWALIYSIPLQVEAKAQPGTEPSAKPGTAPGVLLQLGYQANVSFEAGLSEALITVTEPLWEAAQKIQVHQDLAERESKLHETALRMTQVEEIERQRISKELHDGPGQSLVVIRLQLEMLELSIPATETEWRERLAEARDLTETTILDIRRLISDLRPPVLDQLGLNAGIRQLLSRFRRTFPCSLHFKEDTLPALNRGFEIVVYRLLQECLMNIRQHSQAKRVTISLTCSYGVLRLQVHDNGKGFDYSEKELEAKNLGLAGLSERAALLGGTVRIVSTPAEPTKSVQRKKTGTKVDIEIPIP